MPSPNLQPSDYVAAFTWDRLIAVARILFEARKWVAEDAKPERGDSRTGIGFRAWEHSKYALTIASITDYASWLSVKDGGARYLVALGGMPARFYRGEDDEPVPENYADPDALELAQLELGLANNVGVQFRGYWRFIVRADATGFPVAVFLVGVDFDNVIRMAWEIPLEAASGGATPIMVPQTPVPLPPLTVLTVAEANAAAREEAEQEEREREARRRAEEGSDTDIKGA